VVKAVVCKTAIPGSTPGVASKKMCAGVAELVDARDLKSLGLIACAGSSPALGTILRQGFEWLCQFFNGFSFSKKIFLRLKAKTVRRSLKGEAGPVSMCKKLSTLKLRIL
jgi:hypothetical protein